MKKNTKVNPDEVTFGVEIECYLPNQNFQRLGISIGSYHRGNRMPEPFPAGWNAQSDSSLSLDENDPRRLTFTALEIVSPPLKGLEGLMEIERVIDLLKENKAIVTEKCGLHVHVGMRSVLGERSGDFEMISEWVRRLLHLTAKHEAAMMAVTGTRTRINNHYAGSVKSVWEDKVSGRLTYNRIAESYPTGGSNWGEQRERERIFSDHRYRSLNLANLFGNKKTVEFRIFAGTMNGTKVVGYVLTALGLAVKAAENTSAAAWDKEMAIETTDKKYYVGKVKHLHDRLAWMDAASRVKYGFPSGAWERYGAAVKKNQIWNAEYLARKIEESRRVAAVRTES